MLGVRFQRAFTLINDYTCTKWRCFDAVSLTVSHKYNSGERRGGVWSDTYEAGDQSRTRGHRYLGQDTHLNTLALMNQLRGGAPNEPRPVWPLRGENEEKRYCFINKLSVTNGGLSGDFYKVVGVRLWRHACLGFWFRADLCDLIVTKHALLLHPVRLWWRRWGGVKTSLQLKRAAFCESVWRWPHPARVYTKLQGWLRRLTSLRLRDWVNGLSGRMWQRVSGQ